MTLTLNRSRWDRRPKAGVVGLHFGTRISAHFVVLCCVVCVERASYGNFLPPSALPRNAAGCGVTLSGTQSSLPCPRSVELRFYVYSNHCTATSMYRSTATRFNQTSDAELRIGTRLVLYRLHKKLERKRKRLPAGGCFEQPLYGIQKTKNKSLGTQHNPPTNHPSQ